MDEPGIAEINDAAAKLYDVRDRRIKLGKEEQEAEAELIKVMKEHKKKVYKDGGIEVRLEAKDPVTKAKVRIRDTEEEEPEEQDPDRPIGDGTMPLPGEQEAAPNRKLETGRAKMAAARKAKKG